LQWFVIKGEVISHLAWCREEWRVRAWIAEERAGRGALCKDKKLLKVGSKVGSENFRAW
jgi:hypothetical protein